MTPAKTSFAMSTQNLLLFAYNSCRSFRVSFLLAIISADKVKKYFRHHQTIGKKKRFQVAVFGFQLRRIHFVIITIMHKL